MQPKRPSASHSEGETSRVLYLCVCKYVWRDDLVGPESLSRVDKGGQDLSRLATFAWREDCISDVTSRNNNRAHDLLAIDDGSGLLRLKPMAAVVCSLRSGRQEKRRC